MKILVIEDEITLLESISKGLRLKGFSVDTADNGEDGLEKALFENYDAVILDLNLPKLSGFEVLENLVIERPNAKIIILSARDEVESKLQGFKLGAVDYMTKPFHFDELEMRIRVLIHRDFTQQSTTLTVGRITLDTLSRNVLVNENSITLTAKEVAILEYFMLNKCRLVTQTELIEHVWDESVDIMSNSVRVHMSSLRKKLKSEIGADPFTTKIGEGYILNEKT